MDDGDDASTTQHERVHEQLARLMAGGKVDPGVTSDLEM
jgi:hypothetical protein